MDADSNEQANKPKRGPAAAVVRVTGRLVLVFVIFLMSAWASGAIYFSNLPGAFLRITATIVFLLGTICLFAFVRKRRVALGVWLAVFAIVLLWWLSIAPSNDRDWALDMARTPHATVRDKLVTVHDIRNFEYASETEYTPRYYDKTFDLDKLESVDFIVSYWGGLKAVGHTFVSFCFAGDECLAVSIEVRKEKGETYSPLAGLFKQYELIYIAGDERDLIRSRTNFRNEDVYLYRTNVPPEKCRLLFMDYIKGMNRLAEHPVFYNTLTNNCSTNILDHTNSYPPYHSYSYRILLNGYSDELIYDHGSVDTSVPFAVLKERSRITDIAKAAGDGPEFSAIIRGKTEK